MSKAEELQEKAGALPEPLAAEVLDFLEFVTARHEAISQQRRAKVSRLRGSLKGSLSSSSDFSASKADEIDQEL